MFLVGRATVLDRAMLALIGFLALPRGSFVAPGLHFREKVKVERPATYCDKSGDNKK